MVLRLVYAGASRLFLQIMLEIFEMLRLGQLTQAALYLLVTIVTGLLALAGGYSLGIKWA